MNGWQASLPGYAAGEHVAVWQALNAGYLPLTVEYTPETQTGADVEDVMRQTFGRFARNVDRTIERLHDLRYSFACEIEGHAPRRPVDKAMVELAASLSLRFGDDPPFDYRPYALMPRSFCLFGEMVGSVDLMQAYERPTGDGPVISNLGDWDPLVVSFEYPAMELADMDLPLPPLPGGGVGAIAEIATGLEHKADVSGAMNVEIHLPGGPPDPIVHAEGIALPFTTWLRRHMARGGFFGVRHVVRSAWKDMPLREVEPGFQLPDHPIFQKLAAELEPF